MEITWKMGQTATTFPPWRNGGKIYHGKMVEIFFKIPRTYVEKIPPPPLIQFPIKRNDGKNNLQ